jgi:hypothetical protein
MTCLFKGTFFQQVPSTANGIKESFGPAQKSYKEALLSQGRKVTQNVPLPEQLERLLLTPQYHDLRERLFGFFITFWSRQKWLADSMFIDVDTRKSHLTRKRCEDSKEYEPE